jgi:hypothetical protein
MKVNKSASRGAIRTRKVGGIRFIWIGRLVLSFCVKRRPKGEPQIEPWFNVPSTWATPFG